MTSHYDLEQAKTARDEGMKQAESKIDPKWRQHVLEAIRRCAAEKKELLVDDVWWYLEDAIGKGINGGNLHADKNYWSCHPQSKESAREYFLYPNRDFVLVCQLAGFDHEYVRMKVRKRLNA